MKKTVIAKMVLSSMVVLMSTSHAGFFSNTAHSRANCATFVESVTWNGQESHWWRVKSLHTSAQGAQHMIDTFMAYTWRAAAFHSGESLRENNPWTSQGYHFYMDDNGREIYDVYTMATDCSAYDGWWSRSIYSLQASN